MLRPLLFLSALIGLAGAQQTITSDTSLDISSCPITFYGETYYTLYVSFLTDNVAFCFNDYYDATTGDCVVAPAFASQSVDYELENVTSETAYRDNLQDITVIPYCEIFLTGSNGQSVEFKFGDFGSQAALIVETLMPGTMTFDVIVNGATVDTLTITDGGVTDTIDYLDISRCRSSGVLYQYGDPISDDPDTCTHTVCSMIANIYTTTCGYLERCLGNHNCILDPICTVTGPTVIDFYGRLNDVRDRCEYTLLDGGSIPGFDVVANFRERRRKDVSFLDSVTLELSGWNYIYLEQGGRVLLNDDVLTLNSSTQDFQGVELSKDETGVTAKVMVSDFTVSVFFDGYTAQIFFTGPDGRGPSLDGLCAGSSAISANRLSSDRSRCLYEYSETSDSTINCTIVTERCNLLGEAPFTACHSHIDPDSYKTACINTMCVYPAVDGLICQFLEAYARACSLRYNESLEDWRTEAGCSPPQALCQDERMCSDHEFCAETVGGEHACFCRGIFARPYRSNGIFGQPTVCRENSASITLFTCFLEENGFNYTDLHLNDESCRGEVDELNHTVTFSFDSSDNCGVVVTTNDTQTIYTNTIVAQNITSDITRQDQLYIDFSCSYTDPDIRTVMSFRIKDSSVIQQIRSRSWNYTLTMTAYTDAALLQAVQPSTEILLDQKIWVELETDGLEGGFVAVVTDSCWATNQASPNASLRCDLITDGCDDSADETVAVDGNGEGTSNSFSFNMFQFSRHSGEVYLHCQIHLCDEVNESCAPDCTGADRRRRSARMKYVDEASAFITMSWTN